VTEIKDDYLNYPVPITEGAQVVEPVFEWTGEKGEDAEEDQGNS
jgi:hypothetical protein